MNNFEKSLLEYIDIGTLDKFQNAHIGVAGAGGLGSNVVMNLARTGFKHFTIADFDRVEYKNLNRQFFFANQIGQTKTEALKNNILLINPDIIIEQKCCRINKENIDEIFCACDIVVEAFDDIECKKMLIEKYGWSDKLLVSASGIGGCGDSDRIVTKKINNNFYIIGDGKTEINGKTPPFSTIINIAAAKQADIIVQYVLNK